MFTFIMLIGNGWLTLLPLHLPQLRELRLEECIEVRAEYIEELKAAVPELIVTQCIWNTFGAYV